MLQLANSFSKTNLVLIFQNKPENLRWSLKKMLELDHTAFGMQPGVRLNVKIPFIWEVECVSLGSLMKCLLKDFKLPKPSVHDQAKHTRNTI